MTDRHSGWSARSSLATLVAAIAIVAACGSPEVSRRRRVTASPVPAAVATAIVSTRPRGADRPTDRGPHDTEPAAAACDVGQNRLGAGGAQRRASRETRRWSGTRGRAKVHPQ